MRIPSGTVDQYIYFVAVDSSDLITRETGLTTFTVYRARNGAAAAAYTTPTIAEVSSANMPGVYSLLLDEDMTIGAGNDSEEVVLHITQASMAPVTLKFELYREKITQGETLTVSSGGLNAALGTGIITAGSIAADAIGASELAADAGTEIATAVWAAATRTITALDEDSVTLDLDATIRAAVGLASANLDTQLTAIDDYLDTEIAAILADTAELQADWADGGRLDLLIDAINAKTTNLPSDPADASVIAGRFDTLDTSVADLPTNAELAAAFGAADDAVLAEVALVKAKTDLIPASPAAVGDIPSAAAIADAVWDEALAGHAGAGSTGEQLAAAGAAGDPWATALPGAYSAGSAGKIVGDALDAAVSTRASQATLDTLDGVADAIKVKTDSLTFTVAGQVDANIQYVNDVQVTGTGASGDEWGP